MAHSSQSSQEKAGAQRGGAGQTVVELTEVFGSGLVFWSRQRFETGTELLLRLRTSLLPLEWRKTAPGADWLNLRGLVVDCHSKRRGNGSVGFLVSILVPQQRIQGKALLSTSPDPMETASFRQIDWLGTPRLGLN